MLSISLREGIPKSSRSLIFLLFFFAMGGRLLKALFEAGVAAVDDEVADGYAKGLGAADEDADALGAGDAGVDEVPLEHHVVGHQDGDDHYRELGALGLVDGGGVGQSDLVQFGVVILDFAAVEVDGKRAVFGIYGADVADVAVEDFLVVVVANLHHLGVTCKFPCLT